MDDIKNAKPSQIKKLRESYEYARRFYSLDTECLVIVDVGWGGTIQAILNEAMRLDGITDMPVEGLYIGIYYVNRCDIIPIKAIGYLMPDVFSKKYHPMWNAVIWEYCAHFCGHSQ